MDSTITCEASMYMFLLLVMKFLHQNLVADYEFVQVITTDYYGITAPLHEHYYRLL
jgi:hypothetical protein